MIKIDNIYTNTSRDLFKYSLIIITIYSCILVYLDSIYTTFWYDEAYSIALIKYSFADIFKITAKDVHPPLYYFLLKAFSSIFGNNLFVLRLFSSLGVLAILLVGLFQIRKIFGIRVSFIFILLVCVLPVSQYLGTEIRMYSWLMFFILSSSIYAYNAIISKKKSSYIKFTILAICAAYTHNYGLVAVGSIYLCMLIHSLLKRNNIIPFIISLIVFLAIYGPWIPSLFYQIQDVKEAFWIKAITPKDMLLLCYYFFSPKEPSHPYLIFSLTAMSIVLTIALIIIAFILILIIKNKGKIKAATYFIYIFLFTLAIALFISFLIKPILAPRFMTSVLGTLILSISIYIASGWQISKLFRILCYSILMLFITFSVARFFSEKKYFKIKQNEKDLLTVFIEKTNSNEFFIAPFELYPELAKLSLLFPDNNFYLYSLNDTTSYMPFNVQVIEQIPNIETFYWIDEPIENGNTIFVDKEILRKILKEYDTYSAVETSDIRINKFIKRN